MPPTTDAIQRAQQCARFFRDCGWNALPSRMDRKGPALPSYADYWEAPLPPRTYVAWDTTNVQVMCGAHWRLAVVDCDGPEAIETWWKMCELHDPAAPDRTWVARTGGGGLHYWFTLPAWLDECPSRRVWGVWDTWGGPKHKGDWQNHKEIRVLGDRALVIAPPSVHVKTGEPYVWVAGATPADHDRPAPAPAWVLDLPGVDPPAPARAPAFAPHRPPAEAPRRPAGGFPTRDEILDAIPDKIALAKSWGLRTAAERPNAAGWVPCYAVDREDRSPSASFHAGSGIYAEMRDGTRLSFFDLAAALGRYAGWLEAKDDLAARFACPRASQPSNVRD